MIEGVLRHCTDMEIQRQYVDSHGQSAVGFAFCRLLGFELAPRLKAIGCQKLAIPGGKAAAKTEPARTGYLIQVVQRGTGNFREGILWSRSWRRPMGQIQPQKKRPTRMPMPSTMARGIQGNSCIVSELRIMPTGQPSQP